MNVASNARKATAFAISSRDHDRHVVVASHGCVLLRATKGRLASVSRGFRNRVLRLANSVPLRTIIGVARSRGKVFIRNNPKYRGRVEASQPRRDRSPRTATGCQHICVTTSIQPDRVLPQDTALKGAAEQTSTPETVTTACHAASWFGTFNTLAAVHLAIFGPVGMLLGR